MGRPVGDNGMPPPGGGGIGRPVGDVGRPGGGPAGRGGAGARGGATDPSRAAGAKGRPGGGPAGRGGMPAGRTGAAVSSPRPLEMTPTGRASSGSTDAGATAATAATLGTTGAMSTTGATTGAGGATGASATGAGGSGVSSEGGTAAATFSTTGATTTTGAGASTTGLPSTTAAGAATSAAASAAAAFLVGFLPGLASSSGWTSRFRPSFSARRRTRSPWASSMEDEWLLMPMPRTLHRSTASLFVRPSSLASSWTLIFPATCAVNLSSSPNHRSEHFSVTRSGVSLRIQPANPPLPPA